MIQRTVKPRRNAARPEGDLVRACLDLLAAYGVVAWRNNTTGVYDPTRKCFRTFTGRKGIADILGIAPFDGRILAIECKVGKNKLSPDQESFLKDVVLHGGVAMVARSVDDVEKMLRGLKPAPCPSCGRC